MTPGKRAAMDRAIAEGDRDAQRRIMRWSPGGRQRHHRHLDQARRAAATLGHLLGRFRTGKDAEGGPDRETYWAECQFCEKVAVVFQDWEEEDEGGNLTGRWKSYGTALAGECKGKGGGG
jgi:hypothetical protein